MRGPLSAFRPGPPLLGLVAASRSTTPFQPCARTKSQENQETIARRVSLLESEKLRTCLHVYVSAIRNDDDITSTLFLVNRLVNDSFIVLLLFFKKKPFLTTLLVPFFLQGCHVERLHDSSWFSSGTLVTCSTHGPGIVERARGISSYSLPFR